MFKLSGQLGVAAIAFITPAHLRRHRGELNLPYGNQTSHGIRPPFQGKQVLGDPVRSHRGICIRGQKGTGLQSLAVKTLPGGVHQQPSRSTDVRFVGREHAFDDVQRCVWICLLPPSRYPCGSIGAVVQQQQDLKKGMGKELTG